MAIQNLFDPSQFTTQSLLNNAVFPPDEEGISRRQRGPVGATGLFADGINIPTDVGLGQTRTRSQRDAGTNMPSSGTQFTPDADAFNAMGFDVQAGSQEELMQNTAETMANLKTGKDVTPKQASEAAEVVKQDTIAKGGDVTMLKEAPDGVDKGVWESFNGQFDLTTIGLTLLATNGNGKNLAANMGLALQAGLESKKSELAAGASARLKAEDRALAREGKLASIELDKAKTKNAIADSKAALANITSGNVKPINTTQIAIEQSYLSGLTDKGKAKDMPKDVAELSALHRQTLINSGVSDKTSQDRMIFEALEAEGYLDEKFFGGFALTSVTDRLGL
jgi:hypothetical protein